MRVFTLTVLMVLFSSTIIFAQATTSKVKGVASTTTVVDKVKPSNTDGRADLYSIDFENEIEWTFDFTPWTVVDVDLLDTYGFVDYDFPHEFEPMAFIVFNPSTTTPPMTGDPAIQPHSGEQFGACMASVPSGSQGNDDWFMSDQIPINTDAEGASFTFWAKSYTDAYGLERFNVAVSTTGNDPSDFTVISGPGYIEADTAWTEYVFDLSAYAGQDIYVAIQCVSFDAFVFMIDDLVIDPGAGPANCDDFDSYTAGELLCPQSGGLWTTWDNNPGGPYDGYVTDTESESPPNSLSIDLAVMESDLVYNLNQTTTGSWWIDLYIMVPTGGTYGGYYNIMQDMVLFGTANEWGFQVYFASDGTGYMYDADFNQTAFTYTVGAWTSSLVAIDLDNAWAYFYLDGVLINDWQWDVAGPNMLGVIDLYAAAPGSDDPKFYVDNVCFGEFVAPQGCDWFDTYTAGELLCPQSGGLWTTWDNNPGGPYDGYVTDTEWLTPPNSLAIDLAVMESDLVYNLNQTTTGSWWIDLYIMVPTGGTYGGYYNIMQDMVLFGTANEWGFQVYFASDGTGYMYDADFNQTDFTYTVGEWINSTVFIDLDNAWAEFYLDGVLINEWQWDVAGPNMLGVIDIYAAAPGSDDPMFFIDNVCFYEDEPVAIDPVAQETEGIRLFPNPVDQYLTITSPANLVSVQVFNMVGQNVFTSKASGNSMQINTQSLESGLYIVQIQTENGFETKKFMKR